MLIETTDSLLSLLPFGAWGNGASSGSDNKHIHTYMFLNLEEEEEAEAAGTGIPSAYLVPCFPMTLGSMEAQNDEDEAVSLPDREQGSV